MNNAINIVKGTNFLKAACQTLYKVLKQQVSIDFNGDVTKKVTKNSEEGLKACYLGIR